jgi:hypothetical protein
MYDWSVAYPFAYPDLQIQIKFPFMPTSWHRIKEDFSRVLEGTLRGKPKGSVYFNFFRSKISLYLDLTFFPNKPGKIPLVTVLHIPHSLFVPSSKRISVIDVIPSGEYTNSCEIYLTKLRSNDQEYSKVKLYYTRYIHCKHFDPDRWDQMKDS